MQAPILTVQIGMGENILILAFVIIVIGGIGSIRGAFLAAIFVGMIDTLGRAFLPDLLRQILSSTAASTAAPALSSMLIYLLMAVVLVVRPEALRWGPGPGESIPGTLESVRFAGTHLVLQIRPAVGALAVQVPVGTAVEPGTRVVLTLPPGAGTVLAA